MFKKAIEKYLQSVVDNLQASGENISKLTEKQKEMSKTLDDIVKYLPESFLYLGLDLKSENLIDSIRYSQDLCYFTKEIINKDATTTKELYVVENGSMRKELYKIGNESNEVKSIKGDMYLFISHKK